MKSTGISSNHAAYEEIKQRILDMTYKMRQPLKEEMLAQELSLSRTPIRQALQRLESEGFVEIVPYHGCRVCELTAEDVYEIYAIRSKLEGLCAFRAAERINLTNIEKMMSYWEDSISLFEAEKWNESVKMGARIHDLCIQIGGGRRIYQILANLSEQIKRLDILSAHLPGRLIRSNQQHREIVDAISRRDSAQAQQLMHDHILSTQKDMVNEILNGQDLLY